MQPTFGFAEESYAYEQRRFGGHRRFFGSFKDQSGGSPDLAEGDRAQVQAIDPT